jgi:hypothetical protein
MVDPPYFPLSHGSPAILTEVYRDFTQYMQENYGRNSTAISSIFSSSCLRAIYVYEYTEWTLIKSQYSITWIKNNYL